MKASNCRHSYITSGAMLLDAYSSWQLLMEMFAFRYFGTKGCKSNPCHLTAGFPNFQNGLPFDEDEGMNCVRSATSAWLMCSYTRNCSSYLAWTSGNVNHGRVHMCYWSCYRYLTCNNDTVKASLVRLETCLVWTSENGILLFVEVNYRSSASAYPDWSYIMQFLSIAPYADCAAQNVVSPFPFPLNNSLDL